ncbi:hypothetical protein LZ554_003520 [Drepanopeziza brunnea f. sp. 'monogermtubi']|nr:hypothetical protein LZ554_003520 [Drepanopeziza brunnea f. sp. 'monogermtubi']
MGDRTLEHPRVLAYQGPRELQPKARLARAKIPETKDVVQIVHYVPGVETGTWKNANVWDGMFGKGNKPPSLAILYLYNRFDLATDSENGTGIGKPIRAAYTFICMNWSNQHDEIVLIGFSRDVGLLTKSGLRHLRELFKIWKHLGPADDKSLLENMRKKLQNYEELIPDVKIRACAVTIPANVNLAVQALALGEQRKLFVPLQWNPPAESTGQVLIQKWFAGNHSDVGGGNDDMTLANITLAWMVAQLMDTIQFNKVNLWAITTTRPWAKPSSNDDLVAESDSDARLCKVVATSRISSGLLKSETSWMSWMMALFYHGPRIPVPEQRSWLEAQCRRIFGNENQRPSDANHVVEYHHSVYILRHLGIAKYAQLAPAIDQEGEKSKTDVLRIAEEIRSTRFGKIKFEAELLERWAKHILSRTMNGIKNESRERELLEEASYEAEIPICAILSAFYKLAERNAEDDEESGSPIDNIYADLDTQSQEPKSWAEIWKGKKLFSQPATPAATFRFKILDEDEASAARALELTTERIGNRKPVLVFTRTYPLLMGRAHEMAKPAEKVSLATRISRVVSHAELPNRVPPCKKCCMIWKKKD